MLDSIGSWSPEFGFFALFLLGFLAATLLPLGSEWLLVALVLKGSDPLSAVGVATAGNSLGALTTYALGLWGGPHLLQRILRISTADRVRAEKLYVRYGIWSLLLSWLPVLGDPLCLVGGIFKVGWGRFLILVTLGKFFRYLVVALMTLKAAALG